MLSSPLFKQLPGSARHRICRSCLSPQAAARFSSGSLLLRDERDPNARFKSQPQNTFNRKDSTKDGTEATTEHASPNPANVILKPFKRGMSTKLRVKEEAHAETWALRAERIERGEEQGLFEVLEERGLVKDVAGSRESIREIMRLKRVGAYVGIDPTAPSLHIGHLMPLMPLFWMYMHGYHGLTLLGSATAKVGDPSGRLTDRDKTNSESLSMNMISMHYQLKKLWVNVDSMARRLGHERDWAWKRSLRNNNEWWNKQSLLEFLQLLGSQVRVGPMLGKEMVRRKLAEGDGLSFAELTYTLMQGWDWWELYDQMGIQMQIGGSDQYGNIVQGIEAVKTVRAKKHEAAGDQEPRISNPHPPRKDLDEIFGFTTPLLTDSSGKKIGKSTGGGDLWLDPIKTSPYTLYGYFVRRPDEDTEHMLKLLTFMSIKEISELMAQHETDKPKRLAQHRLAYEVVSLVHGMEVATSAQVEHKTMHGKGGGDLTVFTHDRSEQVLLNSAPKVHKVLPRSLVDKGKVARLLYAAGLSTSVSDGQRLATQQAVYIGGRSGGGHDRMGDNLSFVSVKLWFPEDTKKFLIDDKYMFLRKGKHDVRIIEFISDEEYERLGHTYPGKPGTGAVRNMRKVADLRQQMAEMGGEPGQVDAAFGSAAPPSDSKLQALRKQLAFFQDNFDPKMHNPLSHPDKIKAKIARLEEQQKLFDQPAGAKGQ